MPEETVNGADEVRLDSALQTIKDVIWRFEDACEGRRSVYDVVGCLVEELVREGVCPACIDETVKAAFDALSVDATQHKDDDSVFH